MPKSIISEKKKPISIMDKAIELQSKAAEFGFDWPRLEPVFEKLQEEIIELRHECDQLNLDVDVENLKNRIQGELGDVLFCCMNLARFLKVDPEKALQSTNDKFERRFAFIESYVDQQGKKMQELSLEELDRVWDLAKKKGL
jgi:uncharacterized protein YabN with tetrapyrrole methylase and pyrophosphatase domain